MICWMISVIQRKENTKKNMRWKDRWCLENLQDCLNKWAVPKMEDPNSWMVRENPIYKWMIWGTPTASINDLNHPVQGQKWRRTSHPKAGTLIWSRLAMPPWKNVATVSREVVGFWRLEKNHRIVTTFWALKCSNAQAPFWRVSWYQGKPWLGDRSEDAVLWLRRDPSYGMSIKEKRWNNIINHEIKAVWLAFMLLFLQYCPLQGKNSPKMLKIAVFKTDFGKRWLWATPDPIANVMGYRVKSRPWIMDGFIEVLKAIPVVSWSIC